MTDAQFPTGLVCLPIFGLRAALYRPLLGVDKVERGRFVDAILAILYSKANFALLVLIAGLLIGFGSGYWVGRLKHHYVHITGISSTIRIRGCCAWGRRLTRI
jgi:hypothetical protein